MSGNIALLVFGSVFCLLSISVAIPVAHQQQMQPPPYPVWPDQFTVSFTVYVEEYGPDWKSHGSLFYNWQMKSFRGNFNDWCLPLFDDPSEFNNYSCSFVATGGNMYFVNVSSSSTWKDAQCCLFEHGLGAIPPDWVKNSQYNGTAIVRGANVDVWWVPGTSDPNKPCYGYWNIREDNVPVQFFGLSSLGPTILDYWDFIPGDKFNVVLPDTDCSKECEPPVRKTPRKKMGKGLKSAAGVGDIRSTWPDWPPCE